MTTSSERHATDSPGFRAHRARCALGRMLSHLIGDDPVFRRELEGNGTGDLVVVPGLETDSLQRLSEAVARAGGQATVAVALARDDPPRVGLALLSMETRGASGELDGEHHTPFTPETTVGDLLRMLTPGVSMTMRLQLDDGGELALSGVTEHEPPEDTADDLIAAL